MTIAPSQLRADFPEFADASAYPDASIQFWLTLAYMRLRSNVWQDMLDIGAELYTCHNLVLERRAQLLAQKGAIPGESQGMINSKSVDKVSVGYDTASVAQEGAGNYNETTYGRRFYELVQLVGIGAVQVGTGPNDVAGIVLIS